MPGPPVRHDPAGRKDGGFMRLKATKQQQLLFATRTECALWLQLPKAQRASIVGRYARLITRAAKATTAQRPIGPKEDE